MKKIVVAGASTYGVKNLGDDAMFCNLVEGLRRNLQDCEITFLARHPDPQFDEAFGVRSIKNFEHDSKAQSIGRWFHGFNPGDSGDHFLPIRHAIESCDLLVIGGNSFMEVSESDFLRGVVSYSALLATWAQLFQKPYVLYGVAAHPLEGNLTKQLARFLCGNAEIVTVREEYTKEQLVKAGVEGVNICVLADPAFGLDPNWDQEQAMAILCQEKITLSGKPLIGIGFRHMYWKWSDVEANNYAAKMGKLSDFMIKEFDAELLFIPNCTYQVDTPNEDDRVIAEAVRGHMEEPHKAHFIRGEYQLKHILSLFPLLSLHVSNRRHSCIFAALHRVPIVSMGAGNLWHFNPFLEVLGVPEQVMNFTEGGLEDLKETLAVSWKNRDNISGKMAEKLLSLRHYAHQHTELLAKLIGDPQLSSAGASIGI